MAEDSLSKQVMDAISAPAKKVTDFVSKMTGGASTSAGSASTDNSTHMNWTPKPSAEQQTDIDRRSKQSSGPSYSDHQVSRKERLTRKYGSGK